MKTWKHDQKIEVVKNEHYRLADQVKLDGISWTMVTEQKTAYQMYQSGQLDMLSRKSVPSDILAGLIKKGEAKVKAGSGLEFSGLMSPNLRSTMRRSVKHSLWLWIGPQL